MKIDRILAADIACWSTSQRDRLHANPRYKIDLPDQWKTSIPKAVLLWCEEHIPGRFLKIDGSLHFKHNADMVLFIMHWSEALVDGRWELLDMTFRFRFATR